MLESKYQADLIQKIEDLLPGCFVLKNDTDYLQGVPDLSIFSGDKWAMLEVKRKKPTRVSDWQPNQEWYLAALGQMSYTACIYPENEEDVLHDLQQALKPRRASRVPKRQ